MTLTIESPRIYTKQGVPISVTGVAQVRLWRVLACLIHIPHLPLDVCLNCSACAMPVDSVLVPSLITTPYIAIFPGQGGVH